MLVDEEVAALAVHRPPITHAALPHNLSTSAVAPICADGEHWC